MRPYGKEVKTSAPALKAAFALGLACLIFSGCLQSGSDSKDQQMQMQMQKQQDHEKALKTLEEIESMNEAIIRLLDGPANPGMEEDGDQRQGKQPGKEQQGKQGDQKQGEEQQQDQKQGKGQQQGEEQQGKEQQEQQQGKDQQGQQEQRQQDQDAQGQKAQDVVWDGVNQNIIELHTLLNEYIPAAAKLGADAELGANASNTLNQMTKKAETRNHNEVLTEANNLFKAICDYYSLHQDKRAPAKLLLFHARRVMLSARVGDWQTAGAAMKNLEETWDAQKNTYGDKQKDIVAMLDLSVANLSGAVAEKNRNLAAIKGLIVLNNISELEKSLEEK